MRRSFVLGCALLACACNRYYFSGDFDLDRIEKGEAYAHEIDLPDGRVMVRVVVAVDAPAWRIQNVQRDVEDYPLWQQGFTSGRVLSQSGDDIEAEFTLKPVALHTLSPMHEHLHIDPVRLETSMTGYENDWMRGNQVTVKLSPLGDGSRTLVNFYLQGEVKLAGASFMQLAQERNMAKSALALRRIVMLPQFASQPGPTVTTGRSRVAIPTFTADGVPAETARVLTRVFAEELMRRSEWEVSTPQEIAAVLTYNQQESLLGCDAGKCAIDLGKAVGADRLVVGSIGKVGDQFVVSASVLKVPEGIVEKRVSHNAAQPVLLDLVRSTADELQRL